MEAIWVANVSNICNLFYHNRSLQPTTPFSFKMGHEGPWLALNGVNKVKGTPQLGAT